MSVRVRLFVLIALVALVPAAIFALTALRIHERALDERTEELHRKTAELAAASARRDLEDARRSLAHLAQRVVTWDELGEAELASAVWLLYRQHDDVVFVSLLDEQGRAVAPAALQDELADGDPEIAAHPEVDRALVARLLQALPLAEARERGSALGRAVTGEAGATPMVPLVFAVAGPDGARWSLVAGLSLRAVCADVRRASIDALESFLHDDTGHLLCGAGSATPPPAEATRGSPPGGAASWMRSYRQGDRTMLAAIATVPPGWRVITQQPTEHAFAAGRRIRTQAVLWIGVSLLAALGAGLALARSITTPVKRLVEGTREVARGNFGHRIDERGRDELAGLSHAFNVMGGEIQRRDAEIRRWNDELQTRVEERTRELKEAQEMLLQSQKIAAVSSLGAGIAHEINNPLTSVLGMAQLLSLPSTGEPTEAERAAQHQLLATIETEARRIKDIVSTLLGFSQTYAGASFTSLDPAAVLDDAVKLVAERCESAGITLVRRYEEARPRILGDRIQLSQALLQLLDNSIKAMPTGGTLTLHTSSGDGLVRLAVEDTGRGIAAEHLERIFDPFFTTKSDWGARGLGLTVAFRVVEAHHGKIKATSCPGEGTVIAVTLPADRGRSPLA